MSATIDRAVARAVIAFLLYCSGAIWAHGQPTGDLTWIPCDDICQGA